MEIAHSGRCCAPGLAHALLKEKALTETGLVREDLRRLDTGEVIPKKPYWSKAEGILKSQEIARSLGSLI